MKGNSNTVAVKSRCISRPRKILFSLFIVLIVWAVFDVCLYAFLARLGRKYHIFQIPVLPDSERIEYFAREHFHPKWGWDIKGADKGHFGNRKSREYQNKQMYKIKVFGDSFAYCEDVNSDETWEHFVEENSGWECINFGVPAYGTDQALLKYKDNNIKTQYVILTILDENIGRVLTSCWGFFGPHGVQTKPKFSISDGNSIVLVENPLKDANDLIKMQDIDFFNKLAQDDYWQKYCHKLNMPRRLRWPATFMVLAHADFFAKYFKLYAAHKVSPSLESMLARRKFYHLYDKSSDGLAIMRYIIDEFVSTAHLRGETPIIVLFPNLDSVVIMKRFNIKPYRLLVEHLDISGYNYIDYGDIFVKEQYEDYYHRHFSVKGNRRVAEVVVEYIERREQKQEDREPIAGREQRDNLANRR